MTSKRRKRRDASSSRRQAGNNEQLSGPDDAVEQDSSDVPSVAPKHTFFSSSPVEFVMHIILSSSTQEMNGSFLVLVHGACAIGTIRWNWIFLLFYFILFCPLIVKMNNYLRNAAPHQHEMLLVLVSKAKAAMVGKFTIDYGDPDRRPTYLALDILVTLHPFLFSIGNQNAEWVEGTWNNHIFVHQFILALLPKLVILDVVVTPNDIRGRKRIIKI